MRVAPIAFALFISVVVAQVALSSEKKPQSFIPAMQKNDPGGTANNHPTPAHSVEYELKRPSPDRRYAARVTIEDAEVGYLRVYRVRPGSLHMTKVNKVSQEFADVNGYLWLPRHPHTLIVSTGGADYGKGYLALWSGKGQLKILKEAKTEDGEGFNVRSVSDDGLEIIYEHFGTNSPDPNDKRNTYLHLRLP